MISAPENVPTPKTPVPLPPRKISKRIQYTQAQVDEVVDIMTTNLDHLLKRDELISTLDSRTSALETGASQFEKSAQSLKKHQWWKNAKVLVVLGCVAALAVVAATVTTVLETKRP